MSILLDALKKSEAQRQLASGSNNDGSAASPAASSWASRNWLLLALIAVIVVLVAWFGWRQFRAPDSSSVSNSAAALKPTAAPVAAATEQPGEGAGRRTPVETFALESESGTGDGAGPARDSTPAALEKSQVNQSFTDFEASPQPASAAQREPAETVPSGVAETAAPQAATKPSRPARPPATATEPITFWELPQSIRDSLPDLRITVLVFAERPADRFVLIGGQRRVENDRLQDGLVLEEIRRDGAVFAYRNYRFLVKG